MLGAQFLVYLTNIWFKKFTFEATFKNLVFNICSLLFCKILTFLQFFVSFQGHQFLICGLSKYMFFFGRKKLRSYFITGIKVFGLLLHHTNHFTIPNPEKALNLLFKKIYPFSHYWEIVYKLFYNSTLPYLCHWNWMRYWDGICTIFYC